jgi:hypothetical protein
MEDAARVSVGSMTFGDWHRLARGVGKVLFFTVLTPDQYEVVCGVLEMVESCVVYEMSSRDTGAMGLQIIETLCDIEKNLPETELSIAMHLFVHYAQTMAHFGPSYSYWMMAFERMMSLLSRGCHDRALPEDNICNNYAEAVSLRTMGLKFKQVIECAVNSVDGRAVACMLTTRKMTQHLDHFPRRRNEYNKKTILLSRKDKESILKHVGSECEIENEDAIDDTAWILLSGVRIGGHMRGCQDLDRGIRGKHFYKSAFELMPCPLCASLNAERVFGTIQHFLSIDVRGRQVDLAKVNLFRQLEQGVRRIKLPAVNSQNPCKVRYVIGSAEYIGHMKVFVPCPETKRLDLVLDVSDHDRSMRGRR